jgi:hypothetical protein
MTASPPLSGTSVQTARCFAFLIFAVMIAGFHSKVFAERPMAVDDAAGLQRGDAKMELGWLRDARIRGFEAAVGYAPIDNLEVELSIGRARDRGSSSHDTLTATGVALKWVPVQSEQGLSAGLKYEFEAARTRYGLDSDNQVLNMLLSWNFTSGHGLHLNLGRSWSKIAHASDEVANLWGIGLDVPLTERLHLTTETFGTQGGHPDRQVGLRYEIFDGLKVSVAAGQGNKRSFGSAGLAWEY